MRITDLFGRRVALVAAGVVGVILIGGLVAFKPVTRNLVASEFVCSYCHLEREYVPAARLSFSMPHPAPLDEGEAEAGKPEDGPEDGKELAQCVDCHLPDGFLASAYMYTHIASASVSNVERMPSFRNRTASSIAEPHLH